MNIAIEIARRVRAGIVDEMNDLRLAEHDLKIYAPEVAGMVFDSAEGAYEAALESRGVSRDETRNLSASAKRVLLRSLPRSGAGGVASSVAMAFDAGPSVLDSILNGVEPPKNVARRSVWR